MDSDLRVFRRWAWGGQRMPKIPPNRKSKQGDLFGCFDQPRPEPQGKKRHPKRDDSDRRPAALQQSPRFFCVAEIAERYQVSLATVWRWVKINDDFPAPMKLSAGVSRWSEEQLFEFERRVALRMSTAKSRRKRKEPGS